MKAYIFLVLSLCLIDTHYTAADTSTYRCKLKSNDDSLSFTMSDPRLPSPVIIGANGGNPLQKLAEVVTPDKKILIMLYEELIGGRGHLYNLILEGKNFRIAHQRWTNPDPNKGFYGICSLI